NSNVLNTGDGICFFNENKELIGTNINKTENNLIFPNDIKGIKPGVKIYRNYNKDFDDKLLNADITRKIPAKIKVRQTIAGYFFCLFDNDNNCAVIMISQNIEKALNEEKSLNTLKVQLSKMGNTEFYIETADIKLKQIPYLKVSKINEIRRALTEKLRKIRKKNYKSKYGKQKINVIDYPIKNLNCKANILNDKSMQFYKKRNAQIGEYALESQENICNREVMVSKYCIKNQLGICPKQNPVKKYKEPFILNDEFNKEYLVEFNCKDCVMKIKTKN
ncbi:MAG: DUF3656 domain-containing protein, partial [Candidatus Gastranaerophilales bacterium]|nr:DUF3656 domain-containing protein [Candidatus Gastranaerophilales bacterium]